MGFWNNRKQAGHAMSLVDHLDVLRSHLLKAFLAIVAGAVIVGLYNQFFIREVLLGPTHPEFFSYRMLCSIGQATGLESLCMQGTSVMMQSTGVNTQFSMFITITLAGGFILAFPYVFYQFWKFIKPALTPEEAKHTKGVIFWVSFLFFSGVVFGYFVITPYTVHFFSTFQLDETIENRWTISSYIGTIMPLVMGTGLAFQLPLMMLALSKIGIVTSGFLKSKRKHGVVIMLIVAGVITPPDVLSQVIVTIPLIILYEVSILLVRNVERGATPRAVPVPLVTGA